ncbi:MAG: ABC transporter permease [Clostridiales bacterium]|jgi:ABC-2 type transport system permease protein|nr:ABC transporter permease [Clostridiales bacterium]
MWAIIKREISSYFTSAIGWVFLAAFYAFAGWYFYAYCLMGQTSSMTYAFASMFTITMFLVPILTMRIWSEEKKQRTDQALFTAPVKLLPITLGKYFAALAIYAISLASMLVFALILTFFGSPDWTVIIGNLIGLFLLGAALIAIGMFISALTENQVIAAIGGFVVAIFVTLIDTIANAIPVAFISKIIASMSFNAHYNNFTVGILDLSGVVFFLSVIALFVFLTTRIFEKKRWS